MDLSPFLKSLWQVNTSASELWHELSSDTQKWMQKEGEKTISHVHIAEQSTQIAALEMWDDSK